ncbi:hypothetical protein KY290_003747 [Solanum tuberosum]|uniref:DNA-directed RNA polymerase n=1 Tax=Solanum tuberosum TaxID=4113 RepID=A0ABQ7WTR4_SOLTU|nr:hypothetical protein KY284_000544 [Solanum tuberosum]KAH0784149.1 hypothetical protein KY290_003747 [Solanum tuberosum]
MLSTSWMPLPTCASGYAVGVLIGDKLHLNPVHAVVQLRPSKRNLKEREKARGTIKEAEKTTWDRKGYWRGCLNYHLKNVLELGFLRLSQLPLEERVRTRLLEGPPIHRFDALKHLALDNSADEIIRVLQIHAQLVQGLWVPKSSLVYGTNSGVEVLVRNFVLYEFTKGILIKKSVFGRRPEFLKAATPALKSLAVERPDLNDWKLKVHPDKKFENLYGDVVREKQATWECLGKQINDVLPGGRNRPTMKNPLNPNADIPALPSGDKPTSSSLLRTSMSEEIREALPKVLQEVFRTCKVCSFQQIRQGLRKLGVSKSYPPKGAPRNAITASIDVFDAPQEEIQAVINQVAVNIHGVYVLKSSPDNPQYDTLRKVVIDLFMAEGPSAKLKKASVTEAAKLQLNRDITNVEFLKLM